MKLNLTASKPLLKTIVSHKTLHNLLKYGFREQLCVITWSNIIHFGVAWEEIILSKHANHELGVENGNCFRNGRMLSHHSSTCLICSSWFTQDACVHRQIAIIQLARNLSKAFNYLNLLTPSLAKFQELISISCAVNSFVGRLPMIQLYHQSCDISVLFRRWFYENISLAHKNIRTTCQWQWLWGDQLNWWECYNVQFIRFADKPPINFKGIKWSFVPHDREYFDCFSKQEQ